MLEQAVLDELIRRHDGIDVLEIIQTVTVAHLVQRAQRDQGERGGGGHGALAGSGWREEVSRLPSPVPALLAKFDKIVGGTLRRVLPITRRAPAATPTCRRAAPVPP